MNTTTAALAAEYLNAYHAASSAYELSRRDDQHEAYGAQAAVLRIVTALDLVDTFTALVADADPFIGRHLPELFEEQA